VTWISLKCNLHIWDEEELGWRSRRMEFNNWNLFSIKSN